MTLTVVFFTIHIFRMTTFFLIAGFFARMSLHRRGDANFIKDRLQSIAVPLVVGWPILFPATRRSSSWAATFPMVAHCQARWIGRRCYRNFPSLTFGSSMFCWNCYAATLVLRTGVTWLDKNGRSAMLTRPSCRPR